MQDTFAQDSFMHADIQLHSRVSRVLFPADNGLLSANIGSLRVTLFSNFGKFLPAEG